MELAALEPLGLSRTALAVVLLVAAVAGRALFRRRSGPLARGLPVWRGQLEPGVLEALRRLPETGDQVHQLDHGWVRSDGERALLAPTAGTLSRSVLPSLMLVDLATGRVSLRLPLVVVLLLCSLPVFAWLPVEGASPGGLRSAWFPTIFVLALVVLDVLLQRPAHRLLWGDLTRRQSDG